MTAYILDQTWEKEAERLRALEDLCDPETFDLLDRLGVGPGWRCLEVGGGRGSVARRLAERVGPSGHVLAVDLDLTLLADLESDVVSVRRMDITRDTLPVGFDLVHARHVVSHLADRHDALRRLTSCLRPGGILLIEEADFVWTDAGDWPVQRGEDDGLMLRVWDALVNLMKLGGYDGHWGRRLPAALIAAGLDDVEGQVRARIVRNQMDVPRLMAERFREALLESGGFTVAELDTYAARVARPEAIATPPLQVAAWGRRPVARCSETTRPALP